MVNLKLMGATLGGGFLLGTLGGGYMMHKFMWGKAQAEKVKTLEVSVAHTQGLLIKSKELAESASKRAEDEARARIEADNRLSQAYRDNALLAQSRASTTTRIIERGQEIGKDLKTDYPWIYNPWPERMSNYAFNIDSSQGLSGPQSRGYPAILESPIP